MMVSTRSWFSRAVVALAASTLAALAALVVPGHETAAARGPADPAWTAGLPAGRWVPVATRGLQRPGFRYDHSAAVYDPRRDRVLLFGADTHRATFDNALYSLSLDTLQWRLERAGTPPFALRTDGAGRRVAGLGAGQPWPMHIYDSMVYDPRRHALLVMSGPKHSFLPRPGAQSDPTWEYSLDAGRWQVLATDRVVPPNFFATGAVYDAGRDTVIAYGAMPDARPFLPLAAEDEIRRVGVWELGPARDRWVQATAEVHHWGWFNVEYDLRNRVMLVFGGDLASGAIWAYTPGRQAGEPGSWERRIPAGASCPGGYYNPAAYDSRRGTTLFLARDLVERRSVACVYDYASNRMTRIENASLPLLELNYTMIYSARLDVFVLVTGSFSLGEPTGVLVLKPAG